MFKGVFTELDPEQMKRRLSLADIEKLHFDGKSTGYPRHPRVSWPGPRSCASKVDEPLEVRGEIPLTLPPNTMGNEAYTDVLLCVQSQRTGRGRQRRSAASSSGPNPGPTSRVLERTWNREQVLPIRSSGWAT